MRKVFLIISLLCLMPFAMMAQGKGSSYDEKLEQAYGAAPMAQDAPKAGLNQSDPGLLVPNMGYCFSVPTGTNGSMYKFDPANGQVTPEKDYNGFYITAAEVVPYNSTTDLIYAYASDGKFGMIDQETREFTAISTGISTASEMAYDVTSGKMYGLRYGILYEVNLTATTEHPVIGELLPVNNASQVGSNNWIALAVDSEGHMYGITNTYSTANAKFYSINTADWNVTLVANLPYTTQYAQTMSFDRTNDNLYWWQASNAGFSLLKVNPTNGACTPISLYNGYQMTGMLFKYSPESYTIAYNQVLNGTVTGPTSAAANDEVEIFPTPDNGYRLESLTWNGNAITVPAEHYTFVMPASAVVVNATFALNNHDIIVIDPKDGTLATNPEENANYNSTVTVLPTPDPGMTVDHITALSIFGPQTLTAAPWEFTMPDADVTVSAVYTQVGVNTLSIASDLYGYFNDVVTVDVALANENYVTSAMLDIPLGANLEYVPGSIALSDRAEGDNWGIMANVIAGNTLRVMIYNTTNGAMPHFTGNSGSIFSFDVNCNNVAGTNPLVINTNSLAIATPDNTKLTVGTVNGALEIRDVTMNQPANVNVCNGNTVDAIAFSSTIPASEGPITYVWTNSNPAIGLAASGTGNIPAFTATNTTNGILVATIGVTPTLVHNGHNCTGSTVYFAITVNPDPDMVVPANIAACNGASIEAIEFASNNVGGQVTYAWTNDNTAIGLAASGNGNIPAFTATNTTTGVLVANITVTPTFVNGSVSCVGDPVSFTIQVAPEAIMADPANIEACEGATIDTIEFASTNVGGQVTYAWTNDNTAIGLAASGNGNIPAFTATNTTAAPLVANITVTPTFVLGELNCPGDPVSFTITVMPVFTMNEPDDIVACPGATIEAITFTTDNTLGVTTYAWTNDNTAIGLAASGTGNIAAFQAVNTTVAPLVANVTVTPTCTIGELSCVGTPVTFTITVNPTPVMNAVENQEVLHGENTTAIHFTSNIETGVTYSWSHEVPAIGLAASGTGDIAAFQAVNTTADPIVDVFTVTPTYTANGLSCVGEPVTFTITVNPYTASNEVADQLVCAGSATADVHFSSNITLGTVAFSWTNDTPAIGLAASGTGDIASFIATNNTNTEVVATITYTPTFTYNEMSWDGDPQTFTITVTPEIVMNAVADVTVYSRESTTAIQLGSNIASGVVYNWTNDNPAIGLAANGTGNIPSFVAVSPITTPQVANITATPSYTTGDLICVGEPVSFTITVMPTYLVVCNTPTHGTLNSNANVAANYDRYAYPGQVITLTATPATGYLLENVTVTALGNNNIVVPVEEDQYFTMPDFDVECTATFIDGNDLLIKPSTLDLGYRPINAWMYSKFFTLINNTDDDMEISQVDMTNYAFFNLETPELPFTIESGDFDVIGINTNYKTVAPGLQSSTLALVANSRRSYTRRVLAHAYTAVEPDVWELATTVNTFPYLTTQATAGVLYDNYQLPGDNADGYDGVYKLVLANDVLLSAAVIEGEDPKVVLYDEDFRQVGGPHVDNYHDAPEMIANIAVIGNGSTTTNYMPYYTYYKNSICQFMYTADELANAGLQAGKINSIEFNTTSTYTYTRNLKIWMANVTNGSVTSTTVTTANMALVFDGSFTQAEGWNEYVFNGEDFIWDGESNILVTVNMASTTYDSRTVWTAHNPGFVASVYTYSDYTTYNPMTQTYNGTTSSSVRPDIVFNGADIPVGGGMVMGDDPIFDLPLMAGTYYLVASTTSDDSYTLLIDTDPMPLPEAPVVIYPLHGAQGIETPVTLQWECGEYTHEYQLVFGLTYPPTEVVVDWTDDLTGRYNAGDLLHNTIYYWRVNERNSSGVTEGPLWVFTTELNVPQDLTVFDDELYEGEDALLSWISVNDRSIRGYNVYQDGVKINAAPVTTNDYVVSGLTYNMEGYDFYVTAVYDEGESDASNIVTVLVSGEGSITGHVYEQDGVTGIAGVHVTIAGVDEYGYIQTYDFYTNASGVYSGDLLAGMYVGLAEKDGYQSATNMNVAYINYEETTADYDFIMDEEYYPVGRVIAEEIDDDNVHVYWMWQTPFDGIFVDFSDGQVPAGWTVNGDWQVVSSCPSSLWGGAMPTAPFILADSDTPGSGVHITGTFTSPVFDASFCEGLFVDFDHYAKASLGDVCEVQVSSDGTNWTTVAAYTGSNVGSWASPAHASIDITNYASETMQVRFFYDDLNGWKYGWAVDNISIYSNEDRGNDRSFVDYRVYRRSTTDNTNQAVLLAEGLTVEEYYDVAWGQIPAGVYQWGVSAHYEGNRGESEIVWSNLLDKDMYAEVTVHVTTNSNDNVEGAMVSLLNVSELDLELEYDVVLDETGYYTWDEFRKGEYIVSVELDGYEPILTTASIWDDVTLNYVLTEIVSNIDDLYVSTTGWAIFGSEQSGPTGGGELTVYDGMTTNYYVPVYGLWVDDYTKTEMIMPAADLSEMVGYPIQSMTFYLSTPASGAWAPAEFQIFMKEVSNTTLSSYIGMDGATVVYEGMLDATQSEMYIPFSTPYTYTGGNLLIGIYETVEGTYKGAYFYGVEAPNGSSASGYGSSPANVAFNSRAFLPKTTFAYGNVNKGGDRAIQYYNVKLDGIFEGITTHPFFQHDVEGFYEGEVHTTSVQAVYGTGASDWIDFIWEYTPCENFAGLQGDPTAQWDGEDIVLNWTLPEGTGPVNPTGGDEFFVDFENGLPTGWATIDADGDGYNWEDTGMEGHNGGACYTSASYVNYVGPLTPNNYLVSPQVTLGGYFSFWACAQDASYAAEHFGVAISTGSQTNASDFTTIQEWTMTAKAGAPTNFSRNGSRTQGNWYQFTVDLSSYAGQTGYIAIRHFNCTDMFYLNVDDVALSNSRMVREVIIDEDFENGLPTGWATIDADGDGYNWEDTGMEGHNGGACITSASYVNYVGPLTPNNYLVTPQVALGGTFSFWACAQDASYAAEHFGVAVSTASQTNANDFTTIQEWTMTAKAGAPTNISRDGSRTQGNWYQYTVDLSSYAGQVGFIAIRHFNCTDEFYLNVDDVLYEGGGSTPVIGGGIIGVEIFRDGEWLAEVYAPIQTYTDVEPGDVDEYEIRVIHDGLTSDWTYYAMSCPEVAIVGEVTCQAPENLEGDYLWTEEAFGALISWTYGEEPVPPVQAQWYFYDNGNNEDAIGTGGGQFWWGVMFPAGSYAGGQVIKVAMYDYMAMTGTVTIYNDGSNAPSNAVGTANVTLTGSEDFVEFEFATPVNINPAKNVWVVFYNQSGATYPASVCANTGDANGRWVSLDGSTWEDLMSYSLPYTFMVRAYIGGAKGEVTMITTEPMVGEGGTLTTAGEGFGMAASANTMLSNRDFEPIYFNVYRDGAVIATVPFDGEYEYGYFDEIAIGNYDYQVTAVYDNGCESDFALTPDLMANYVNVTVTAVEEIDNVNLYPNPTQGSVTIEAPGMTHITVVSVLGQVVYDADINADNTKLHLGQYQAGVYMVRINTESGVSVKRVTVVK